MVRKNERKRRERGDRQQPHQVMDGGPAPDGMQIHTAPKAIAKRMTIHAARRDDAAEERGFVVVTQEPEMIELS